MSALAFYLVQMLTALHALSPQVPAVPESNGSLRAAADADTTTAGASAASTASTTAEVPTINRQPSVVVTASTDAMQVEPAISSAQHEEELQPPVSFTQPAGAATAIKMGTEVGIGLSCRHA